MTSEPRKLTRFERRYLSRRICSFCDMPLDRESCGAIYEACPRKVREKRRADCLAQYRARKRRRK